MQQVQFFSMCIPDTHMLFDKSDSLKRKGNKSGGDPTSEGINVLFAQEFMEVRMYSGSVVNHHRKEN